MAFCDVLEDEDDDLVCYISRCQQHAFSRTFITIKPDQFAVAPFIIQTKSGSSTQEREEILQQHSAMQDFSVLEALEAQHLVAKQDGGTVQSLQGIRLPIWTGQNIPGPAAPPGASASNSALGFHAHPYQSQVTASARWNQQSHTGRSHFAASGLSDRCKPADVSWQQRRPLGGQHQQGTVHAMGITSSSSHNPDDHPGRTCQTYYTGNETTAGSASGTTGQHSDGSAGMGTAAQTGSCHSRHWQQPSREQRPPVRTAWEPGGTTHYLPSRQQRAQQTDPANLLAKEVPASTAMSAGLGQHAEPPGQPSYSGSGAPVSSSGWDDWQPNAGDEHQFWGQDEELDPAQWVEAPEQCPESLPHPGEENFNDGDNGPLPNDLNGEEASAAVADDAAPRLVQYTTTNKGVLVDRCVQTPP